jgi:hypothetical protein
MYQEQMFRQKGFHGFTGIKKYEWAKLPKQISRQEKQKGNWDKPVRFETCQV